MKKLFLIAAMAVASLGVQAQQKLYFSTYNTTDLDAYDGKVCNVTVKRYVFSGWNTIALPFSMNEQELNEVFGSDCRLERLMSVEDADNGIVLNFIDCKSSGLAANTPYMLHYTGEPATLTIAKEAEIIKGQAVVKMSTQSGETVTMEAAQRHIEADGLYGVLARDNSEVRFVAISEETTGFYPTRCFIRLASGTHQQLTARHLGYGEATSINAIAQQDELVDVYSTSGQKVASQMRASEVSNLHPSIYIVKGQKILVR